jgi:hypothetical protein
VSTIDDLYQAVDRIRLRDELPELIRQTGTEIALKVEAQLQKGEQSTGEKIKPEYGSPIYASKKYNLNPLAGYGTPDLKLTGEYYKGIGVAIISDTEYAIESDVPYANNNSLSKYGDNVLRLSEQSKEEYIEETLALKIQAYITEKTGLTFS